MQYHDNDVRLSMSSGYSLIDGSYEVESFSVTEGQDPDHFIHKGLVASFGSDGKMTFRVGRKGSSEVAKWFNDRVPASQTTFDHGAGDLNFAFLGTLKMTITGGVLGGGRQTFTFAQVALAQGHSGLSNNWWFGGQNCSYIQNNQVNCKGSDSKGSPVFFVFLRGGNDVSTVDVTPTSFVETAGWMSRIDDSRTLDQLMMPGSHDAGMSELHHCNPPIFADPYTQTQSGSIGAQLVAGSRYFDIRVDYDYDELVTYHRSGGNGCNGQSLRSVLDQAAAFLAAHRSETFILKFSHIRDYDGHDPAVTKQKINDLLKSYNSNLFYANANAGTNLAKVRLGDARGRMILVFDYSEFIDPATGRFRYKDGSTIQPGANITVYDEYSETADYEKMKSDQLAKWKDHGGLGTGHFFLLSWTLTSNNPPSTPSISSLAAIANSRLPGVLHDQIAVAGASKPNIVYVDYVASAVCQSIVLYNF